MGAYFVQYSGKNDLLSLLYLLCNHFIPLTANDTGTTLEEGFG